jgi:hypothetical protein
MDVRPVGIPGRQFTDLEIVAVDGDVVGVDRDGATAGIGRALVLAQAPHALLADHGRQRVDEAAAVVVALGGYRAVAADGAEEEDRQLGIAQRSLHFVSPSESEVSGRQCGWETRSC